MSLAEIKNGISKLGTSERIALAAYLDELFVKEPKARLSEEWRAELTKQMTDIDAGKVTLVPWEEVSDELRWDSE